MIARDRLYSEFYQFDDKLPLSLVQWIANEHSLPQDMNILDIGCGPGRMLSHFAETGWNVTGMEPDETYFAAASKLAETLRNTKVVLGGFGQLNCSTHYDLICALKGPFYYLPDLNSKRDALVRCFDALKQNGILLIDYTNFIFVLANYRAPGDLTKEIDGHSVRKKTSHKWDFHNGHLIHQDEFYLSGEERPFVTDIIRFSITVPQDVVQMMEHIGFSEVKTYSSYTTREAEACNGSQVIICGKKKMVEQTNARNGEYAARDR